jgi:hypothetical protein
VKHEKFCANEYQECKAFWEWAQYNPILAEYLYKIVNEGKRTARNGASLKLIGLRAGLPDYHLPIGVGDWNGLWIEMKTRDQSDEKQSQKQKEWIRKLKKANHYATFAYGWEHAAKITTAYLQNKLLTD